MAFILLVLNLIIGSYFQSPGKQFSWKGITSMKIRASQVMVPIGEIPVIHEDDNIFTAVEVLVREYIEKDSKWQGYESLLVVDKHNQAVGLLTLRSALKGIGMNQSGIPNSQAWNIFTKKKDYPSVLVMNLMRNFKRGFVNMNDHVEKAIRVINEENINSVLVLDGNNLVGVIRAIDLFWFIDDIL